MQKLDSTSRRESGNCSSDMIFMLISGTQAHSLMASGWKRSREIFSVVLLLFWKISFKNSLFCFYTKHRKLKGFLMQSDIIFPDILLCDKPSTSVVTVANCYMNGEISWKMNCPDLAVFGYRLIGLFQSNILKRVAFFLF